MPMIQRERVLGSLSSLELLFDAALDAIVGMNAVGQITHWNRSAETIFGWRREETIGREMASVIIPEGLREAHRRGLQRYLAIGVEYALNRRLEMLALRRDGSEFAVELTIVPIRDAAQPHFFGFLRDISERKLVDHLEKQRLSQLELLYESSLLAQRDIGFEDALSRCLGIISRLTGWQVGHVYLPDRDNPSQLISSAIWHFENEGYRELSTSTAKFAFAKGYGLPGRIWQSGEPEWIPNFALDSNFPRAPICLALGLKSGFGFPVGRERLYAVLEFFSDQEREVEPHLILAVKTIGQLISRVIEKQEGSERQHLLLGELRHRVGNILHIAGALFHQSVKAHESLGEVETSYRGQLQALAAAQRLIFESAEHPITLAELIGQVVAPYGERKFSLNGKPANVSENSVVPIALVLNELATNAVKHGSLSQNNGVVDLHWQETEGKLEITWAERGGPVVGRDQRTGFGRQLLERTIVGQLGGTFSIEFLPSGIVARITVASSRL